MKTLLTLVLACLALGLLAPSPARSQETLADLAGTWSGKSRPDSTGLTFYLDLKLAADGTLERHQQGVSSNTNRVLPRRVTRGTWTISAGTVVTTFEGSDGQPATQRWTIVDSRTLTSRIAGYEFQLRRR
ncbi:MAG: hypothetical protein ABMA26_05395 [Limisphaerales bacterium]